MRRQRGSTIQIGSSWFIKYRTPDGKQKMQGESPGRGFKTQTAAQARLIEVLKEINDGDYIEPKSITFAEFADQWIEHRVSIGGSTESAYRSIIRQHLVPHLGALPVHDIQRNVVQALVKKLNGELSEKSLRNSMTLLRVMLVGSKGPSAIKQGYLRHDPTLGVELPSREPAKLQLPTRQQVWKLIDTAAEMAKTSRAAQVGYGAILVDGVTGLRRGEILASKYCDIDWFAEEVLVRRSIVKAKANDGVHKWTWRLGSTKNKKQRRVGLPSEVLRFLAELKQTASDPDGFIFTREMAGLKEAGDSFIDPDYFDSSIYRPVAVAAHLSGVRFHDLRHFFASMLIAQGESAKYVCDQMGHSSIQVTFDIYGHLFPQAKQEASARLSRAMFEGKEKLTGRNLVEKAPETTPGVSPARRPN